LTATKHWACQRPINLTCAAGKPANFRVYDVVTPFRVWGPIHEQLRDLPDGATVEFAVVE
jgi:hypothetical protein